MLCLNMNRGSNKSSCNINYLFEELVPVVLIKALIVLEFLLILCRHRGNGNYTGRKTEEIVKDCVTENTCKERQ